METGDIVAIALIGISLIMCILTTASNKDLQETNQKIMQETLENDEELSFRLSKTDKELLDLIKRLNDCIKDQAKEIRDLKLKQLELEYKHD